MNKQIIGWWCKKCLTIVYIKEPVCTGCGTPLHTRNKFITNKDNTGFIEGGEIINERLEEDD